MVMLAIVDSLAYTVFELSSAIAREMYKGRVGRVFGPYDLDRIGLLFYGSALVSSFAMTITNPLMPILTAHYVNGRVKQAWAAYLRVYAIFAVGMGAGLVLARLVGSPILEFWVRHKYRFSPEEAMAFSLLASSLVFKILNGFVLTGFGQAWAAARNAMYGCAAMLVIFFLFPNANVLFLVMTQGVVGLIVFGLLPVARIHHELWTAGKHPEMIPEPVRPEEVQ
jgi:hypothetical protein